MFSITIKEGKELKVSLIYSQKIVEHVNMSLVLNMLHIFRLYMCYYCTLFFLGIEDFVADCISNTTSSLGLPRFERFGNVVEKAGQWVHNQQVKTS